MAHGWKRDALVCMATMDDSARKAVEAGQRMMAFPFRSRVRWSRAYAWLTAERLAWSVGTGYVVAVAWLFLRHRVLLASNEFDGVYYMLGARNLAAFDDRFHGPGYPLSIRLASLLVGDEFAAAKLVVALSAIGVAALTWCWARQVAGPTGGLLALAFWGVTADVLVYSILVVSDMPALFGLGLTLAALTLAGKRPYMAPVLAGALAGLTYLTRYLDGYVAVAVGSIYLLWPSGAASQRTRGVRLTCFWFAFVLVCLPWFWRMLALYGNPFWNENYLNIAFKAYADRQWRAFPSHEQFPNLLSVVTHAPLQFLQAWWGTLYQLPTYLAGRFAWAGLCFLPGIVRLLYKPQPSTALALAAAGLYTPAVALTWLEPRLLLPLYPLVAVALATVLTSPWLPDHLAVYRLRLPVRALLIVLVLGSLLYRATWQIDVFLADEAPEYRAAGEVIARRAAPDAVVLTSVPHIALYAHRPLLTFGDGLQSADAGNLGERLRVSSARYLAFDARFGAAQFPHLAFLLTPDAPEIPTNLRWLATIAEPLPVVVYEVVR